MRCSRSRGLKRSFRQGGRHASTCCAASTSRSRRARSSLCSARRARASRPCSRRSGCSRAASKARSGSPARRRPSSSDGDRTRVRRDTLGFVYQFHHLLPDFTAAENVVIPQLIRGATRERGATSGPSRCSARSASAERLTHRPSQLSGGEQQRVAVARALANRPAAGPRRRAHRQSRRGHRRHRLRRIPPPGPRRRQRRPGRHPQRADRREDGPGAAAARGRAGMSAEAPPRRRRTVVGHRRRRSPS